MADSTDRRPDPERLLEQVRADERRGRLKVFLGYASGVGKSFQMFDEGRRRRERGQDVVVGALQPSMGPEVEEVVRTLEVIPQKTVGEVPLIDVPAILQRRPQICLVDGIAYDNPPGSRHAKRYQDVEELLEAGITVVTSVNVHHVEELQDEVERLTGRRRAETVPRSFVEQANEILIVDASPEKLGSLAPETPAAKAQKRSELRAMALLLAADIVDRQLEEYLEHHGVVQVWGIEERILVCLTPSANAARMIASGKRIAERFHGDLFALYVLQRNLTRKQERAIQQNLEMARKLGARVKVLEGGDPVDAILRFARSEGITQILVGHTLRRGWRQLLTLGPLDRLLDQATDMDLRVFPQADGDG